MARGRGARSGGAASVAGGGRGRGARPSTGGYAGTDPNIGPTGPGWEKRSTPGGVVYWFNPRDPYWRWIPNPDDPTNPWQKVPWTYVENPYEPEPGPPTGRTTRKTRVGQQARELTAAALEGVIAVPYGRPRIGGAIFFHQPYGPTTPAPWLAIGYALGQGPIGGNLQVHIPWQGTKQLVAYPGAPFWTYAEYALYTGVAAPAAADAVLAAAAGQSQATFERYPFLAYVRGRYVYNQQYMPDEPRPLFTFDARLLYDPRSGLTVWSDNPALATADYATNRDWGACAQVWWDTVAAAADHCDVLIAGAKRHTVNGVLMRGATHKDNLDTLRAHFRCNLIQREGKYVFAIEKTHIGAKIFAFTERNSRAIGIRRRGSSETPTRLRLHYTDKANDWNDGVAQFESPGVRLGTEEARTAEYSLEFLTTPSEGQRQVMFLYKDLQLNLFVTFLVNTAEGLVVEPFDVGDYTNAKLGLTLQELRTLRTQKDPNGQFRIETKAYSATVFDDSTAIAQVKPATTLSDPYAAPGVPAALALLEEVRRIQNGQFISQIKVSWTPPTDDPNYGATVVKYQRTAGPNGVGPEVTLGTFYSGPVYISDTEDLSTYTVRLKSLNRYSDQIESAQVSAAITPANKTTPPTPVPAIYASVKDSRVHLYWLRAADLDLIGYELRIIKESAVGAMTLEQIWNAAVFVAQTDATFYEFDWPYDTWRILVCAYDSGKRYSAVAGVLTPAYAVVAVTRTGGNPVKVSTRINIGAGIAPDHGWWMGHEWAPGDANNLMIIESNYDPVAAGFNSGAMGTTMTIMLAKYWTFQNLEDSIVAVGKTLQDYENEHPYTGFWGDLPANAKGSAQAYGCVGFGAAYRNREMRIATLAPRRVGDPAVPDFVSEVVPTWDLRDGPVIRGQITDGLGSPGLRLSSNSPRVQHIIETLDWQQLILEYTLETIEVPLDSGSMVTNGSGEASAVLAQAMGTSQYPAVDFEVSDGTNGKFAVSMKAVSNTGFTVFVWNTTTGAAASGVTITFKAYDRGGGGTLGAACP